MTTEHPTKCEVNKKYIVFSFLILLTEFENLLTLCGDIFKYVSLCENRKI